MGRHGSHQSIARRRARAVARRRDGRHLAGGSAARSRPGTRRGRIPQGARADRRTAMAGGAWMLDTAGRAGGESQGGALRRRRYASIGGHRRTGRMTGGPAMKPIPLVLIVALATPVAAHAQSSEPKTPASNVTVRPPSENRAPAGDLRISNRVVVGEDAPDFELSDANGGRFRLSQMRGRRLLLHFADRRVMLPAFAAVAESLRALGVTFVGICHD